MANQDTRSDALRPQFAEGTPVYGLEGDKLGTVSEHNVQGGYLVLHRGLFREDVYVPLDAIMSSDVQGIYLRYSKDDVLRQDWSMPPQQEFGNSAASTATDEFVAGTTTDEEVRVPVREEELVAGTRVEETGRVRLHKEVVEEEQTVTVPVRREEVRIERVPAEGRAADAGPDAFTTQDIEVPVIREEVVIEKQPRVKEEIRVTKDVVTDQEQVSDTVRKERLTVEGADDTTDATLRTDTPTITGR